MANSSLEIGLLRWKVEGTTPTRGELQVLKRLALGDSQIEAAARMGKSQETVRKQAKMARARLGAKTNTQAVAIAISLDLI